LVGATVVWLGDVNGDGRADAAVGLPAARNGAGRVVILNGQPGGWPVPPAMQALSAAESSLVASQATAFGHYLAPVGDVNGDQMTDFAVADPNNSLGGGAAVYLFLGSPVFQTPVGKGSPRILDRNQAAAALLGNAPLGEQVVPLGDVNGDSLADFIY